jgi:predicted esterase
MSLSRRSRLLLFVPLALLAGGLAAFAWLRATTPVLAGARENDRTGGPWPVHQGEPLAGVKTVEGFPEGGLRYRVRMPPDASREKPARLILWLHPSFSLANTPVERMAPLFAQRGFALLVPTQKEVEGWAEKDSRKFLEVTLPAVGKLEGLDARKPVLMGFSAGGQVALTEWGKDPGRWGGLILDAAYPLLGEGPDARGEWAMRPVPDSSAVSEVPIFVLVGTEDGWSWQRAEPTWKQAGVPLTVHYIQGRGHEWLFDAPEAREILTWLEQLPPP